jgi:hypothetical protein
MRIVVCAALLASACKKAPPPPPMVLVVQPSPPIDTDTVVDALTPPPPPTPPDLSPPPKADTMNGDPSGPQQAVFGALDVEAQRKVQSCLSAIPASAPLAPGPQQFSVKYDVGNDGKPTAIDITGAAPAETIACAKSAIEGLAFPAYKGAVLGFQFQIQYSRTTTAPAAAKP